MQRPRSLAPRRDVGFDDLDDPAGSPYRVRANRPWLQRMARIGLWSAVGLGCVGGVVAMVAGPRTTDPQPVAPPPAADVVPAPVAGVAELAVGAWLQAGDEDSDELDELFVEPPERPRSDRRPTVVRLTTVAGSREGDGYWTVTVAADVTEEVTVDESGPASEGLPEPLAATWYVEVGIVGDEAGALAALSTPALLPALPPVAEGWSTTVSGSTDLGADDPIATTAAGFLRALMAGDGEPERYVAAGSTVAAADPAPFLGMEVTSVTADALDDGRTRVLATAEGITPGGFTMRASYELMLAPGAGRWEVVQFSGAPTLVARSEPEVDAAGVEAG